MTKTVLLLTNLILISPIAAAAADQTPLLSCLAPELGEARKVGPAPGSTALFVAVPALDHAEGVFEVKVEVFVDGVPTLVETMKAEAWPGLEGPTALPLLVSAPEQRETLRSLVEGGSAEVDLGITVDGRKELWISLADAIEQNTRLLSARFRPLALRFEPPQPPAIAGVSSEFPNSRRGGRTCEQTCEGVWQRCMSRTCPPGEPRTCQVCDCVGCNAERRACLDDCNGTPPPPPGCTQPTVTEFVERSLVAFFPSGLALCFIDNPFNLTVGRVYEDLVLVFENRRIRRTEACDGTVTIQVIDTFTTFGNCGFPTFSTCPFPLFFPFNVCP